MTTRDSTYQDAVAQTRAFVRAHHATHDPSHDFAHVDRVVRLALHLARLEDRRRCTPLDTQLVTLTALLHDVHDRKYPTTRAAPTPFAFLAQHTSLPPSRAKAVQEMVENVSYSHELAHPDVVAATLATHPELGVVQDADRLDAIGAVGLARVFSFGAVKGRGLDESVRHFGDKLVGLGGMMKTGAGREMARERVKRVEVFGEWFGEEVGLGG